VDASPLTSREEDNKMETPCHQASEIWICLLVVLVVIGVVIGGVFWLRKRANDD